MNCLIRAFSSSERGSGYGDLLASSAPRGDGRRYCLSVTDGQLYTHEGRRPVDESTLLGGPSCDVYAEEGGTAPHRPTWRQVLEFLADECARIKGDRLTTLFRGTEDGTFLDAPCAFGDSDDAGDDDDDHVVEHTDKSAPPSPRRRSPPRRTASSRGTTRGRIPSCGSVTPSAIGCTSRRRGRSPSWWGATGSDASVGIRAG